MKHLTIEQRYTIQVLSRLGISQKDIVSEINKNKSVVSRELKRNTLPSGHDDALPAH